MGLTLILDTLFAFQRHKSCLEYMAKTINWIQLSFKVVKKKANLCYAHMCICKQRLR